jgi:hypothetical protein
MGQLRLLGLVSLIPAHCKEKQQAAAQLRAAAPCLPRPGPARRHPTTEHHMNRFHALAAVLRWLQP